AKRDFKKNFKTYKDTKKKVKEIKKSRVGPSYYPVVAMPPDGASSASGSQQTNVKPFRNDRKEQPKKKGENRGYKPSSRKEDANFTETEVVTQFNYMEITLPAVELKGFNGKTETTTRGLRWTVCLGIRPPSQDRRPVPSMSVAIFAFRVPDQPKEFANEMAEPRSDASLRMTLSRLATQPDKVKAELKQWLGDQAHVLDKKAWAELCLENAWEVRIDQCALGLRSPKSDLPVFKPTRIVTSDATLASGLRPLPEDEAAFRELSKELAVGQLAPDMERADNQLKHHFGSYIDLYPSKPEDLDMELEDDVQREPDEPEQNEEGAPRKIRRRFYRSEDYWKKRAAGMPPLGPLHEGPQPQVIRSMDAIPDASGPHLPDDDHVEKRRRVTIDSDIEEQEYEPSIGETPTGEVPEVPQNPDPEPLEDVPAESSESSPPPDTDQVMEDLQRAVETPVPSGDDDSLHVASRSFGHRDEVLEVSLNVMPEDITEDPLPISQFAMSQPNKKAMTSALETPLNDGEIVFISGLLHRAIAFNQGAKVLASFRASLAPKQEHAPATYMIDEMKNMYEAGKGYPEVASAGMTDASKRRFDDAHEAESLASFSDWSAVHECGADGPPVPVTLKPYKEMMFNHVNKHVQPPEKDMTFSQWGKTECQLPKVQDLKLNYKQLIFKANSDAELRDYLVWLKGRFGTNETGEPKGKVTMAVDLAMYLEAVGWSPCKDNGSTAVAFSRKFKD
ncbi:unnamed protein product, partial [Cladocopium goreaui]